MTGVGKFSNVDQLLALREERRDGQKIWDDTNNAKLKELVTEPDKNVCCLILRANNIDVWMNVWRSTVTGTLLEAT